MLRYVTAGESHGKQLTVILEGIPAGLRLTAADVNAELGRRQEGYGRGARMKIEKDAVEFVAGVRHSETIGSPVCMVVKNFDWENWQAIMSADGEPMGAEARQVRPRPGHADLPAAIKYNRKDLRDILERASARETAARVAAGAVCKRFLAELGIRVHSWTAMIGGASAGADGMTVEEAVKRAEKSPVRAPDEAAGRKMMEIIAAAEAQGDTVGGIFTVVARGVPAGLGSHTQWDLKLDARIAGHLMSIQAVKGVSFGLGAGFAEQTGRRTHDEIFYTGKTGYFRKTNNAGGIEGGISNGEDIIAHCVMKPIPSLKKPMHSVNMATRKADLAEAVRSDVCAVPAAGVIGEAAMAFELARAIKEKFGGDSLEEARRNYEAYKAYIKTF